MMVDFPLATCFFLIKLSGAVVSSSLKPNRKEIIIKNLVTAGLSMSEKINVRIICDEL